MIVKFKRLNCNPQLPSVLKSCLQLIDWRNLDQIKAVINQCLSILDFYQDDEENGIILATVIDCLSKFCVLCSELPIDRQIENYGDKCNQDENDCEIKPKLTWPMKTVIDILRSIRTWLSSRSSFVRNSSLECIDEGLYALRNIQDEYLPMVHQTWSSLVLRLNDSSISCRISSYQTIQREAEICSSFIRRRFESDAWPHLRKFLISRAKITKNMNVESISNRFLSDDSLRFQSILCETMIRLIAKIGYTSERILEEYRDVFWTYYAGDNEQMAMLREKVKESLKFLPQVDKTQNM
uniref:TTI1 C-terminal TPR domain-containing protein n=1 Tax=Romanomermis culicivorax TaxID=13658 RepID=A0A915IRV5_ROMCU